MARHHDHRVAPLRGEGTEEEMTPNLVEYVIIKLSPPGDIFHLHELGNENGWQLVSVVCADKFIYYCLFKREKQ